MTKHSRFILKVLWS